jgi:hypothetical protein
MARLGTSNIAFRGRSCNLSPNKPRETIVESFFLISGLARNPVRRRILDKQPLYEREKTVGVMRLKFAMDLSGSALEISWRLVGAKNIETVHGPALPANPQAASKSGSATLPRKQEFKARKPRQVGQFGRVRQARRRWSCGLRTPFFRLAISREEEWKRRLGNRGYSSIISIPGDVVITDGPQLSPGLSITSGRSQRDEKMGAEILFSVSHPSSPLACSTQATLYRPSTDSTPNSPTVTEQLQHAPDSGQKRRTRKKTGSDEEAQPAHDMVGTNSKTKSKRRRRRTGAKKKSKVGRRRPRVGAKNEVRRKKR